MEAGLTDRPDPLHALLAASGRHAGQGPARSVFLPIWAAYPAVGFAGRDALPGLRSDAADRVAGRGRPVTWPLAFLHLVAESARMALRELDRLEAAAEQGREVVAGNDKRSRLPDALDALLRARPDAQGTRRAAQGRATDRDRVAARAAGEGGGPGGDRAGEFPRLRDLTTRAAHGCLRLAIPPGRSRSGCPARRPAHVSWCSVRRVSARSPDLRRHFLGVGAMLEGAYNDAVDHRIFVVGDCGRDAETPSHTPLLAQRMPQVDPCPVTEPRSGRSRHGMPERYRYSTAIGTAPRLTARQISGRCFSASRRFAVCRRVSQTLARRCAPGCGGAWGGCFSGRRRRPGGKRATPRRAGSCWRIHERAR